MKSNTYDRSQIHFEISGKGTYTLVFLHGVNSNTTSWDYIVRRLKKSYKIICIDLRGHGKSPEGKFDFGEIIEDVHYVLHKEKARRIILIGNSFGGLISLEYYKRHPKDIAQVIFFNPYAKNIFRFQSLVRLPFIRLPLFFLLIRLPGLALKLFGLDKTMDPATDYSTFYKKPFSTSKRIRLCFSTNASLYARAVYTAITYRLSFEGIKIPLVLMAPEYEFTISRKNILKLIHSPTITFMLIEGTDHLMLSRTPDKVLTALHEVLLRR